MAKKAPAPAPASQRGSLFANLPVTRRQRRILIIPRLLEERANDQRLRGKEQDNAHEIILRWADLEQSGGLARKETSVDANFLLEVFGKALGYKPFSDGEPTWDLERQFAVPGVGSADGALGAFGVGAPPHKRRQIIGRMDIPLQ